MMKTSGVAIFFGVTALCLLAVLVVSPATRARLRVFLTKAFFRYKYDYRKEWLRFIATLAESGPDNVSATAIGALRWLGTWSFFRGT
jgi:hypothetical protein